MTATFEVLLVDDAAETAEVATALASSGHTVHACFPAGTTCVGVSGTCPLDDGVDVALTASGVASVGAICSQRAGVPIASSADDLERAVDGGWDALRADIVAKVGWTLRSPDGVAPVIDAQLSRAGRCLTVTLRGPAVSKAEAQEACTRAYDAVRASRRRFPDVRLQYTGS